jgi:hypothetical protein
VWPGGYVFLPRILPLQFSIELWNLKVQIADVSQRPLAVVQLGNIRPLERFMKTRRLMGTFVLLTSLTACSISASADQKLTGLQTSLGNGTVGGYVNSTGSYQTQPLQTEYGDWWQVLLHWFRLQR